MNNWVVLTVLISIFSSILSLVLPENENKKAFRVLCGLVMVFVMLLPLFNFSDSISDIFSEELNEDFSVSFAENNEEVIYLSVKSGYENALTDKLKSSFSHISKINVELDSFNGELAVKKVSVFTTEETDNHTEIKEVIYDVTGCNCEVEFIDEN